MPVGFPGIASNSSLVDASCVKPCAKRSMWTKLFQTCRNSSDVIEPVSTELPSEPDVHFSPKGRWKIVASSGSVTFGIYPVSVSSMLGNPAARVGSNKIINAHVAIKTFDLTSRDGISRAIRENWVLQKIMKKPHPHLQTPLHVDNERTTSKIAVTDLRDYRELAPIPDKEFLKLMRQVGTGVEYLHSLGFLHLNLSFANILIYASGDAVVADIGGYIPGVVEFDGYTGSSFPEANNSVGTHSDVFGLAALLYAHFFGEHLSIPSNAPNYLHQNLIPDRIREGLNKSFDAKKIEDTQARRTLIDTLIKSLSTNPAQRPKLSTLISAIKGVERQLSPPPTSSAV